MSMLRMAWDLLRPTFQPAIDRYLAAGGRSPASDDELAALMFGTVVMRLTPEFLRYQLQHAMLPLHVKRSLAAWFDIQLPLVTADQRRGLFAWTYAILAPYAVQLHHEAPMPDQTMVERETEDGEYDGPEMVLGPRLVTQDETTSRRKTARHLR